MKARILASHIEHALGGPLAPELQAMDIVRQACDWVSGAHSWRFLVRPLRLGLRAVINLSGATYTHSTRTLTKTGAFTAYEPVAGDRFEPASGTGVPLRSVLFESRTDANAVVLAGDGLGSAADTSTDVAGRFPNDSIALPADFLALDGTEPIWAKDSIVRGVRLVSHQQLTQRRTANITEDASWFFIGAYTQLVDEATGESMPVLEIHPPAGTAVPDAFQCYYRARIVIDGDLDTGVVRIPSDRPLLEQVLARAVRATAMGYEEGDEGDAQRTMDTRLAELMASPTWLAAKKQDGLAQPTVGPLQGGVGSRRRGFRDGGITGSFAATPTP
jgi:hypothetical protein